MNSEVRETYVDPLIDVVETYLKLKENSSEGGRRVPPYSGAAGI